LIASPTHEKVGEDVCTLEGIAADTNRDPKSRSYGYAQVAAGGKFGGFSAPSDAALKNA
jgi:hypothetical protein